MSLALRTEEVLEDTFSTPYGLEAQVLGIGLEAYKSWKMSCPRPRTALFFDWLKRKNPTKDNISHSLSIRCFFSLFEKWYYVITNYEASHTKTYFKGHSVKALSKNEEKNALQKIVVFISANTSGAGGTNCKTPQYKAIQSHNKESGGSN